MTPLDDALRSELKALYAAIDAEVAAAAPRCQISGRCCRFREYDHTLFVAEIEAALLLAEAPPPARPLDDDGASCPWQDAAGRCTARDARPSGCRVFFCDPSFAERMPVLAEAAVTRLKALADRHHRPWNYAPLHRHLRAAIDEPTPTSAPHMGMTESGVAAELPRAGREQAVDP